MLGAWPVSYTHLMLNIGVRAVETARYRLRKKMELDSSVDLVQFLIDI